MTGMRNGRRNEGRIFEKTRKERIQKNEAIACSAVGLELPYAPESLCHFADLHVHTCMSGGRAAIEEIVKRARSEGIGYLSITNRNNISPNPAECEELSARYGITLVPGMEFRTFCQIGDRGINVYVNGLWFDLAQEEISELLTRTGGYPTLRQAVGLIKRCPGAAACLTHLYSEEEEEMGTEEREALVLYFKELGGDALEVFCNRYDHSQTEGLIRLSERYKLLPAAGSGSTAGEKMEKGEYQFYQRLYRLHEQGLKIR